MLRVLHYKAISHLSQSKNDSIWWNPVVADVVVAIHAPSSFRAELPVFFFFFAASAPALMCIVGTHWSCKSDPEPMTVQATFCDFAPIPHSIGWHV